jgi:hypothetical protein
VLLHDLGLNITHLISSVFHVKLNPKHTLEMHVLPCGLTKVFLCKTLSGFNPDQRAHQNEYRKNLHQAPSAHCVGPEGQIVPIARFGLK